MLNSTPKKMTVHCTHLFFVKVKLKNISYFTGQRPCTVKTELHYCFDYAQQVHYPHYCQQVGPLFFKTPRKCQCFGVCSEGSGM
jgi:hypothetical protein